MGNCLEERGNLAILVYFTLFGSCFIVSSTFYMVNLERITPPNDDPDVPCVPGLVDGNAPPGSMVNCGDLQEWKLYALIGIIHGILCLFMALLKLWPILKRTWCQKCCSSESRAIARPQPPTLRKAAGGHAVRRANDGMRRLVTKDETKRTWATRSLACGNCIGCIFLFLMVIILWIISIAVPAFIGINLYTSDAIRAKQDELYIPAIALFATCLTSFSIVCVSCIFIIMETDQECTHHHHTALPVEDPEGIPASESLRPATTTTGTTTEIETTST